MEVNRVTNEARRKSAATTAASCFRGERWPLSRAVGTYSDLR
jgi:hypothetical protein